MQVFSRLESVSKVCGQAVYSNYTRPINLSPTAITCHISPQSALCSVWLSTMGCAPVQTQPCLPSVCIQAMNSGPVHRDPITAGSVIKACNIHTEMGGTGCNSYIGEYMIVKNDESCEGDTWCGVGEGTMGSEMPISLVVLKLL